MSLGQNVHIICHLIKCHIFLYKKSILEGFFGIYFSYFIPLIVVPGLI